ncbi:MAG: nuclease A inhibitor family protein [Chloroherpetonaceae bacterium]|nr:nuclease A inhibitor family protein [Chloroherpetonaceae bacterium]
MSFSELKKLTDGLLYPSESDFPLIAFHWPEAKNFDSTSIEKFIVSRFYNNKSFHLERSMHENFLDPICKNDPTNRFNKLNQFINRNLRNPQAFLFSENDNPSEKKLFIVGSLNSGEACGFHTTLIET